MISYFKTKIGCFLLKAFKMINLRSMKLFTNFYWLMTGFTKNIFRVFNKHCERIQKFRETVDLNIWIRTN